LFNTFISLETLSPLSLQITAAAAWVGLIICIAWVVSHFTDSEPEIIRKIAHIGMGNVILIAWWLDIPAYVGITAAIFASIITLLSYKFPILSGINNIERHSLGTFFYPVSIGVLVGVFWHLHQPQYAVLGIMTMTWGDGLAALIGKSFGKHKYIVFGYQKSWEGSLTVTLISYFICATLLLVTQGNIWQTWTVSLIVAVMATILEVFSFWGIDNLTVPVGSAACAYLLNQLLSGY
jgi:phytol kinase